MYKVEVINYIKELSKENILLFENRSFEERWLKEEVDYNIIEDGDFYAIQHPTIRSLTLYFRTLSRGLYPANYFLYVSEVERRRRY